MVPTCQDCAWPAHWPALGVTESVDEFEQRDGMVMIVSCVAVYARYVRGVELVFEPTCACHSRVLTERKHAAILGF